MSRSFSRRSARHINDTLSLFLENWCSDETREIQDQDKRIIRFGTTLNSPDLHCLGWEIC